VVHPAYYDGRDVQWLKSFAGGLLTTCGTTTAGSPCEDRGEALGLHGAVSNIPAERVSWREEWQEDELLLTVEGTVRESSVFGPNLVTHRTIQSALSGRFLRLADTIENEGSQAAPLMRIYHFNFGFPLLTERSRVYCPTQRVEGRTPFAAEHAESWSCFEPPTAGIDERVYYHQMQPDSEGQVRVLLVGDDPVRDFAVELAYSAATLPQFIEWKMSGAGHYVLGLEPSNCRIEGRKSERKAGRLRILEAGAREEYRLELRVLHGASEVAEALERQS
jgi:hypothetical protein